MRNKYLLPVATVAALTLAAPTAAFAGDDYVSSFSPTKTELCEVITFEHPAFKHPALGKPLSVDYTVTADLVEVDAGSYTWGETITIDGPSEGVTYEWTLFAAYEPFTQQVGKLKAWAGECEPEPEPEPEPEEPGDETPDVPEVEEPETPEAPETPELPTADEDTTQPVVTKKTTASTTNGSPEEETAAVPVKATPRTVG